MEPRAGLGRALRALVLLVVVVTLSLSAHALGGGYVSPVLGGVLGVLGMPFAWAATRWRLTPARLLAVLVLAQAAAHATVTAMGVASTAAPSPRRHPVHLTQTLTAGGAGPSHGTGAGHGLADGVGAALGHGGSTMLLSHLAATLVLAALLGWGEAALWAVVARLLPALPGVVATPLVTLRPVPAPFVLRAGRLAGPSPWGRAPPLTA